MPDKDDLSQFLGRKPFRRVRKSTGEMAGLTNLQEVPRERVYCSTCRHFRRYKDLYTKWDFAPGRAWRMRFCLFCDTMVEEKQFDTTRKAEPEEGNGTST